MSDDYLWDRTGESDPKIKELEDVLGTLRYQPRPLTLPEGVRPERRQRNYLPWAIAASIAFLILAAGLWIRLQGSRSFGKPEMAIADESAPVDTHQPSPIVSPITVPSRQSITDIRKSEISKNEIKVRTRKSGGSLAKNGSRQAKPEVVRDDMSDAQQEEGRAAKEQVLVALRLVSAKLNFAQRKTQGLPTPSSIRNQHKVG
jgi:hypothetical protein